jgi:hypothetical protein
MLSAPPLAIGASTPGARSREVQVVARGDRDVPHERATARSE